MKALIHSLIFIPVFALLMPVNALAHPGHQHEPGILNALKHAVIGWDQLLILFVIAAVIAHFLLRSRK